MRRQPKPEGRHERNQKTRPTNYAKTWIALLRPPNRPVTRHAKRGER